MRDMMSLRYNNSRQVRSFFFYGKIMLSKERWWIRNEKFGQVLGDFCEALEWNFICRTEN